MVRTWAPGTHGRPKYNAASYQLSTALVGNVNQSVASVRLSVCPFVSIPSFEPTDL